MYIQLLVSVTQGPGRSLIQYLSKSYSMQYRCCYLENCYILCLKQISRIDIYYILVIARADI